MKNITWLLFLTFLSCTKTIVVYDEEKKDFVIKEGEPTENSLIIEKDDDCQVVDNIFIVCG